MLRICLSLLLLASMALTSQATKISNVKVDLVKGYGKWVQASGDTGYVYMGRLTYTLLAEGKDSIFIDFSINKQGASDTAWVFEKTGDIGLVKQANPGDTLKTVYFRALLLKDISGSYIANLTASANMSVMWKMADSLVHLMTLDQRLRMLYASTSSDLLKGFGSDNFTLSNGTVIVGWRSSDGPHGVRWPLDNGSTDLAPYGAGDTVTLFATEASLGCTWDAYLAYRVGKAIAQESRAMGVYCNLGPMVDLVVSPQWGRAFETYGEDPILNGNMGVRQVLGLQSEKVIATSKHFTPYVQETYRMGGLRVVVSERALRELFCVPFEMCVKQGGERALMTCYNRASVPGFTTSDAGELAFGAEVAACNRHLNNDILRNDWGFDGVIMTDWLGGAAVGNEAYIYNTDFDMSMPYGDGLKNSAANVKAGVWDSTPLLKKATRCMYDRLWAWGGKLIANENELKTYPTSVILSAEHKAIALQEARESIVLAKNDNVGGSPALPLDKGSSLKIAVVGPYASVGRLGGGGSSAVTPDTMLSPLQGIQRLTAGRSNISVVTDYNASGVNVAVVCVGVDKEAEEYDRSTVSLPSIAGVDQNALVASVMAKVPRTIVVYTGGSASCAGSWSSAPGIVIAFYPGRSQGQALAEILFGDVNPSGHLSVTFPGLYNDLPSGYGQQTLTLTSADTAHGYFYFEKTKKTPLFWFGHGLSYTTFAYNSVKVYGGPTIVQGERVEVAVSVTNTGKRSGDEVVQLYVKPGDGSIPRRIKDLKAFSRVTLEAGETKTVTFTLGPRDFSIYDVNQAAHSGQWKVMPGTYTLIAGSTSNPNELVDGNGKCVTASLTVQ